MAAVQRWNSRWLKTPLKKPKSHPNVHLELKAYWRECERKGFPYAVYQPGKKWGEYRCDLYAARLRLTEEGCAAIYGVLNAFFVRWLRNRMLPRREQSMVFQDGPVIISACPCPVGEEDLLHEAVMRVLASYAEFYDPAAEAVLNEIQGAEVASGAVV